MAICDGFHDLKSTDASKSNSTQMQLVVQKFATTTEIYDQEAQ